MKSLIAALISLLFAFGAWADDGIIGYVKTVSGNATVTNAGNILQAEPGTPIRINNVIKTGTDGAMGVSFKDNTIMSFGPGTEITVDGYLYSPSKDDLKLSAKIAKGTMEYISGVIAKLKPQAVSIKTPTGTIGMRGTHFLVKVDVPQADNKTTTAQPSTNIDLANAL